MKCPSCRADVADDAAICPNCDHILDPSLFDSEPPQTDDEVTGKKKIPSKPVSKPGAKKVPKKKPAPTGRAGGMRMPEAPAATKPKVKDAGGDWRSKVSKEDWESGGPKKSAVSEPNIKPLDVEAFMGDTKAFIFELSIADKLAFFGAIGMAISCAFPWKETVQEGEVLGLLSGGVVVFVLAGIALISIAIRVRKLMGNLNQVVPWVAQLAAIGGSILWAIVYIRASWDATLARAPVGNEEVWVSKPSFGVLLAFMCACIAALGTLFGLKGKTD